MKRLMVAIAVSSVLLTAAGCGTSESGDTSTPATDVTFALDFSPDGLHAPAYVANDKGMFGNKANVTIRPGRGSSNTIKLIDAGRADIGFADASAVSVGIAGGAKVKAVGLLMKHNPGVTVVRKDSKAIAIKDLSGMSIGDFPQASTGVLFPAVLAANGVEIKSVKRVSMAFEARVPSLMTGKVDAIGGYAQEFVTILDQARLIPWYENGLDSYGTVIVANEKFLEENPQAVRAVLRGIEKGLAFTRSSPAEAAKITAADRRGDATYFERELEVLKPYFVDPDGLKMQSERWDEVQALMMKYGGQASKTSDENLFTNEYLPK